VDEPTMVTLGRHQFPRETVRRLEQLARESRGNVRNFLYSIQFPGKRDLFKSPKDFISDLLCESDVNPLDFMGQSITEHGYIWDIVHENYVDSKNSDLVFMSESMSLADVLDTEIYKGNWYLIPLFSTVSTVMPAHQINHTLSRDKLRSGSSWTKFGNFKMRDIKYRSMSNRCNLVMDIDSLVTLRQYCQTDKKKALDLCRHYKLTSSDMDVMNHLALSNKLKPKDLQSIKKSLKEAAA